MTDVDTLIVGGGISGLSCAAALHLADPNTPDRVAVLEADDEPGGKMKTGTADGFRFEKGPTTLLDNVEETRVLIESLDLGTQWLTAIPENKHRYIWKNGKRNRLPAPPFALLKAISTPILSPAGKIRFLMEPFIKAGDNRAEPLRSFAYRRLGPEAARSLIEPFANGVHAADPEQLEVESAFPKLVMAERKYGNLLPGMFKVARELRGGAPRRKSRMRSFPDGMQQLPRRVAEVLGPGYRGGSRVTAISRSGAGFRVDAERNGQTDTLSARRLVVALPADSAAGLLRSLEGGDAVADELDPITFTPVCLVHIGVRTENVEAPLDGFGHLVVHGEGIRTLGTIYASSLFPGRCPDAQHALLSCFVGGARDRAVLEMSDEDILAFVLADLRRAIGLDGDPVLTRIIRWPKAFPQYHVGHAARQARLRELLAGLPGVHMTGNHMNGISVNDCVRTGVRTAGLLTEEDGR